MAIDPRDIKKAQDLLDALEKVQKKVSEIKGEPVKFEFEGKSPEDLAKEFGGVDKAITKITSRLKETKGELNNVLDGTSEFASLTNAIASEFANLPTALKKSQNQFKKINGFAYQLTEISADLSNYSKQDVVNLKKKTDLEFKRASLNADNLARELKDAKEKLELENQYLSIEQAGGKEGSKLQQNRVKKQAQLVEEMEAALSASQDELGLITDKDNAFNKVLGRVDQINKNLGITGATLKGAGKLVNKLGFSNLAEHFDKGAQAAKDLAAKIEEGDENLTAFQKRFPKTATMVKGLGVSLGGALRSIFTDPLTLLVSLGAVLVKTFKHLDKEAAELGKSLGITRSSANQMLESIEKAAVSSGDMNLNTERLLNAQLGISKAMGTTVRLTNQQLSDQAYLAEFTGLQGEELVNSYKASLLVGKSQEAIFNTVVGQNDSIFSANELYKEAVNTTGQIAVNLGNNPAAIAKAVAEAKRLGINLDTARSMADSTLDFESSIAAEMEAQVLTGKSINLNRARELAFQGDQVGAAKEMLRQVGSTEEFSRMNVLAQKSLAEAMGLSVDELANQLRESEANAKIEQRRQELIAQGVDARQAELRAQAENQTLGEVFNNIMKKLGDLVSKLVLPLMQKISVAIGDGNKVMERLKAGFSSVATISGGLFNSVDDTKYATASILPSVEKIGKFFGDAYNFVAGIPDKFNELKNSTTFQLISGLFSSKAGKLTLAAGGIGLLTKSLMGRGSRANPIYTIISGAGALGDMFQRFLAPKGPKGPLTKTGKPDMRFNANKVQPKTSMLGKIGQSISGGLKTLGSSLATTITKIPGMGAVAKTAGNVVKGGKNIISKVAGSGLVKGLGKVASKGFLKRIPILGSLVGVGFAVDRLMKGDFAGAAMEAGSAGLGLLDLVAPGVGTGLSLAADAAIAARDYKKASEAEMSEGITPESGDQLSDFVIKSLPEDSLVMAGGTQFGKETNDLLRQVLAAINTGGDVYLDGVKVGNTLSLASYKL